MSDRSLDEVMDFALEETIKLTRSKIGYFFYYDEDTNLLTLYSWSKEAMRQCSVTDRQIHYPLSETGLWGEAIRQRKAVITNDYTKPGPYHKGYPEGHVHLIRHLNMPIFHDQRIVALIGVGNSETDYTDEDVQQLQLYTRSLWNITERLKLEQELKASEEKFRTVADFTYDWEMWLSSEDRIIYCSPACSQMTGYDPEEIAENSEILLQIVHQDDQDTYWNHQQYYHYGEGNHESQELEYRIICRDGTLKWIGHACQPVFSRDGNFMGRRISNRDITQRKIGELKLMQSYQEIKNLNDHILQMLSIVSHDIRSPLISLSATLRLLQKGRFGEIDASVMNTIDDLFIRTQRILGVADDCLGKSSTLDSIISLRKKEIDLRQEVIDIVLEELSDKIEQKNISIDNRLGAIPGGTIIVNASAIWLKVAYRNLFGNAIKYGGDNCSIAFGYEDHNEFYRLNVFNTGEPILPEQESLLFTKFGQVDHENERSQGGVGMGLFLVKEIITRHGGEIWHESRPGGNDFIFTLPKKG